MTTSTASGIRPASRAADARTTVLTLIAAAAVAFGAAWIIATAAPAAGADPSFPPLQPYVFGAFAVLGVLAGYAGWRVVRAIAPRPRATLRILVPVALLLSLIPDVVLLATGFIPGATVTGVVALMLMHPTVVAVVVPVAQRLAPVSDG